MDISSSNPSALTRGNYHTNVTPQVDSIMTNKCLALAVYSSPSEFPPIQAGCIVYSLSDSLIYSTNGRTWQPVGGGASSTASFATVNAEASLPDSRQLVAGTNITLVDGGPGSTLTIDASASGAPTNAEYVLMAADTSPLPNSRTLTAGTGITITDGGAGSTVTVSLTGGTPAPSAAEYVLVAADTSPLPNSRTLTAGTGVTITDGGAGSTITVAVTSGTYAPASAEYVLVAADTSPLPNSRTLTAGTGVTITDGGAGSTITVSLTGGTPAPSAAEYVLVAADTSPLPNSRTLTAGTGVTITDGGAGSTITVAVTSGTYAPSAAEYVLVAADTSPLPNSRTLTAGTGVTITDGGAGSTITVAVTSGTYAPANAEYVLVAADTSPLPNSRTLTAGTGVTITDGGAGSTITVAVTSGTYAPANAEYVLVAADTSPLPNSRTLTAGTGVTITDGGAGSTITVAVTSGTYAPANAEYILVAADTSPLPNSRTLTAGSGITVTDGGAGGSITISSSSGNTVSVTPLLFSVGPIFGDPAKKYISFTGQQTSVTYKEHSSFATMLQCSKYRYDCTFDRDQETRFWLVGASGAGNSPYMGLYDGSGNFFPVSTSPFSSACYAIEYNGQLYIAVGAGTNTIAYSYDGWHWTGLGTSIFSSNGYAVKWNGYMWLAGGSGTNAIAYSYNGLNWTGLGLTSATYTTSCLSINWNGQIWMTCGTGTNCAAYTKEIYGVYGGTATSQWNVVALTGHFTGSGAAVGWNGFLWLLGGTGTNVFIYVANGPVSASTTLTFSNVVAASTSVFNSACSAITWSGQKWVAVGAGTNGILYSSVGTYAASWSIAATIGNSFTSGLSIDFNGQRFLAGGTTTNAACSSVDGVGWNQLGATLTPTTFTELNAICYPYRRKHVLASPSNLTLFVGQGTNLLAYTYDGGGTASSLTMYANAPATFYSSFGRSIAFNGRIWLCSGDTSPTNTILWSDDGFAWTGVALGYLFTNVYNFAWSPTLRVWVAVGSVGSTSSGAVFGAAYSYDGWTWSPGQSTTVPGASGFAALRYFNGMFLISAGALNIGTPTIYYSVDGVEWTQANVSPSGGSLPTVYDFGWNGEMFLAVGTSISTSPGLAMSNDGSNWITLSSSYISPPPAGNSGTLYNVVWAKNLWVVVGKVNAGTSAIAYSYDGVTWNQVASPQILGVINTVCWVGDRFLAGGGIGSGSVSVASSTDGVTWASLGDTIFSTTCDQIVNTAAQADIRIYSPIWLVTNSYLEGYTLSSLRNGGIPNPIALTQNSNTLSGGSTNIDFDGTTWIIVGNSGTAQGTGSAAGTLSYSSDNGRTWTGTYPSFAASGTQIDTVYWDGSQWMFTMNANTWSLSYNLITSPTGLSSYTTTSTGDLTATINDIAKLNATLWVLACVSGSNNSIQVGSYVSSTWTWNVYNPTGWTGAYRTMKIRDFVFVCGTDGSGTPLAIATSNDIANVFTKWSPSSGTFSSCYDMAYNGKRLVFAGSGSNSLAYCDNWSAASPTLTGNANAILANGAYSVCYVGRGQHFLALGVNGSAVGQIYSGDGANWTLIYTFSTNVSVTVGNKLRTMHYTGYSVPGGAISLKNDERLALAGPDAFDYRGAGLSMNLCG